MKDVKLNSFLMINPKASKNTSKMDFQYNYLQIIP